VAGCSDIVDDGFNGFLCKAKDASSLADAMIKMIKLSDEQRAILGNNAREKALKNFSQDIIIRKYKETIKELIKNPKRYSLWGIKRYKT
jgi:glycosyltransferase involved in cell wall biosynthesis